MYWSYEYMRAAGWKILSKKIIAFIDATFTVAKRKPETFSLVWDSNPWTRDTGAALFLQNVAYLNKPCVHKLMLLCITSRILKAVTSSLSTTPFRYYWCTSSTPRTSSALILANSRFVIKHSAARPIFSTLFSVFHQRLMLDIYLKARLINRGNLINNELDMRNCLIYESVIASEGVYHPFSDFP